MTAETGFPRALLNQPREARLNYFKAYTMAHPYMKEANEKLISAVLEPADTRLIFVFGPAGVGKTKLCQRGQEILTKRMSPMMEKDPGYIPIVGVEAVGPDSGNWNSKDFYKRLLIAIEEPFIDKKRRPDRQTQKIKHESLLGSRASGTDLRYAVEQALHNRKTVAVFVDEAQHMIKLASGRKLQDQLDSIKSLANMTNTVLVLLGTYELLTFRNLSGQLSRRSVDIHFRRYRIDREGDIKTFKNVLWTFQRNLPLEEEPDLVQHWEYLYERSIGCVGVLKDWLLQSFAAALAEDERSLTLKHLNARALSVSKCEKIISETLEGETILQEAEGSRAHLQYLLGLKPKQDSERTDAIPNNQQKSALLRRRPGTRNPKRDPVGRAKRDA